MKKISSFRTEMSSKAMKYVKAIIKTECLDLTVRVFENAIGDTMIEVKGPKAHVADFRTVWNMVF